jgi:hypothetical protein
MAYFFNSKGKLMILQNIIYEENYGGGGNLIRQHQVPVCLDSTYIQKRDSDGIIIDSEDIPNIVDGDPCFVTLYGVTRHYGGVQEGGWWYNLVHMIKTIPTDYSKDNVLKIADYFKESLFPEEVSGDIYSVNGGQECFIQVEKIPGSCEDTKRPSYD